MTKKWSFLWEYNTNRLSAVLTRVFVYCTFFSKQTFFWSSSMSSSRWSKRWPSGRQVRNSKKSITPSQNDTFTIHSARMHQKQRKKHRNMHFSWHQKVHFLWVLVKKVFCVSTPAGIWPTKQWRLRNSYFRKCRLWHQKVIKKWPQKWPTGRQARNSQKSITPSQNDTFTIHSARMHQKLLKNCSKNSKKTSKKHRF